MAEQNVPESPTGMGGGGIDFLPFDLYRRVVETTHRTTLRPGNTDPDRPPLQRSPSWRSAPLAG